MRPIDKICADAAGLLEALKAIDTATREEAIRLEDAITQAEAMHKTLQKLAKESGRAYIETTKTPEELGSIFGNLYHGGLIGSLSKRSDKYQEAKRDFLALFSRDPGAQQGRAVWILKTQSNGVNKAALADLLGIMGVNRRNIAKIAKALFVDADGEPVIISQASLSRALAYGRGSAYHEPLSRIWAGESIEGISNN